MKTIYNSIVIILLSLGNLICQPKLIIETNDQLRKEYEISSLKNLSFTKKYKDHIIEVFYKSKSEMSYPVRYIDSITFGYSDDNAVSLNFNISSKKYEYALDLIDSLKFYSIETKISPNVVLLDSLNKNSLKEVQQGQLVFDNSLIKKEKITNGTIIVSGIEKNAPFGFFRKIKSSVVNGKDMIIETEVPGLTEAIEEGYAFYDDSLKTSDTLSMTIPEGVKFDKVLSNGKFVFTVKDMVLYEKGPLQVLLNGVIIINPKYHFYLEIKGFKLKKFQFAVEIEEKLEISINAKVEAEIDKSKVLATWKFKPKMFFIGWFPIVISSKVDLELGAKGSIALDIETSVEQEAIAKAGIQYNGSDWEGIKKFENKFTFNPPKVVEAKASAQVYLGPKFLLSLYELTDEFYAYTYGRGFVQLDLDLLAEKCIVLSCGLEANAGVAAPFLGDDCDYSFPEPYKLSWDLWEYRCGLELKSISSDNICPGSIVVLSGNGFKNGKNESYVSFGGVKSDNYVSWTDKKIICFAPLNISPGLVTVAVNNQESNGLRYLTDDCKYTMVVIDSNISKGSTYDQYANLFITRDGNKVVYMKYINASSSGTPNCQRIELYSYDVNKMDKTLIMTVSKKGLSVTKAYLSILNASYDGERMILFQNYSSDERKAGYYFYQSGSLKEIKSINGQNGTFLFGPYLEELLYQWKGNPGLNYCFQKKVDAKGNEYWEPTKNWNGKLYFKYNIDLIFESTPDYAIMNDNCDPFAKHPPIQYERYYSYFDENSLYYFTYFKNQPNPGVAFCVLPKDSENFVEFFTIDFFDNEPKFYLSGGGNYIVCIGHKAGEFDNLYLFDISGNYKKLEKYKKYASDGETFMYNGISYEGDVILLTLNTFDNVLWAHTSTWILKSDDSNIKPILPVESFPNDIFSAGGVSFEKGMPGLSDDGKNAVIYMNSKTNNPNRIGRICVVKGLGF